MCCVKNEADIDDKLTHMQPVVALETETPDFTQYVILSEMRSIFFENLL